MRKDGYYWIKTPFGWEVALWSNQWHEDAGLGWLTTGDELPHSDKSIELKAAAGPLAEPWR